jgi:hypothetical protein
LLDPGEGDDLMGPYSVYGEEGDDVILAGPGADWMSGGAGVDTLSYADRTTAQDVHLDDETSSGGVEDGSDAAWRDKIGTDVENLIGGSAGDTLTGNASQNTLEGNGGGDTLTGLGASDSFFGGAGSDTLNARDGVADTVNCGTETDTGNADGVDTLTACEFLPDTDADGVPEASDACPTGAAEGADHDGDGCKDDLEDSDDDNDTVADDSDLCHFSALAGPDTDGDGCKDAGEDANDDNDSLADTVDSCDTIFAAPPSGCPVQERALTLKYSARKKKFGGELTAPSPACRAGEEVTITKTNGTVVGTARTSDGGSYSLRKKARRGKYFATVAEHVEPDVAACSAAVSQTTKVK